MCTIDVFYSRLLVVLCLSELSVEEVPDPGLHLIPRERLLPHQRATEQNPLGGQLPQPRHT
jgi:hypothetical protein